MYVSVNYTIIGSDNGLSPGFCQAIIWLNAGILSIGPLVTNFSEILIETFIRKSAFYNVIYKMAAILSNRRWINTHFTNILWTNYSNPVKYNVDLSSGKSMALN